MAQIMIVSAGGLHGGRLAIIAAVLKSRGHDVSLVYEEKRPELEVPVLILEALRGCDDQCKPNFEWRRERDYPTLREGIRRKQIKSLRK